MVELKEELLALVLKSAATARDAGQMTLSRLCTDTYPDPSKTSYNDMVSWAVSLTFGHGYFDGAIVEFKGQWTVPHGSPGSYCYSEEFLSMPIPQAVDLFLGSEIPDWAIPRD